jgi:hypothetical protein
MHHALAGLFKIRGVNHLITCHLTKMETALDQVRKAYPKVKPTDTALITAALVLTGRHALALYDGEQHSWPEDYDKLTKAMLPQLDLVNQSIEPPKKTVKSATDEEAVVVTVGLMPNLSAGEKLLEGRDDLKAFLSDALQNGVEYVYASADVGWQWALDRANWNTIANTEMSRRIKIKASFTEGAVGIETGTTATKKRGKKAAPVVEVEEVPVEIEPVSIAEAEAEVE